MHRNGDFCQGQNLTSQKSAQVSENELKDNRIGDHRPLTRLRAKDLVSSPSLGD